MKPLPEQYATPEVEARWQGQWESSKTYRWESALPRSQTYVIDTPPPTVSGMLHMGHIFSYTQADFIARFQRMAGKTVFYPMGFDDNGLPTERLVEKVKKIRATDMPREDFIKQCESVTDEARKEFRELFQSIALSVDWDQEYHTISEKSRRTSQMSFLDLYNKKKAYRKLQPMLWDPVDQTAIAQAEVEDKEQASFFNDIYFEVTNEDGTPLSEKEFGGRKLNAESDNNAILWCEGKSYVVIGTTRPELIPACVGVFFHPDDKRYAGLKGKLAVTPLFEVQVPILTDDTVTLDKGTGIMMCCTFGDEADIEKWRKHNLDTQLVLNKYGKLDLAPLKEKLGGNAPCDAGNVIDQLQGLKAVAAREKILELLKESRDLIESKPITHAVKCAERSGAALEYLPTHQWFVQVLDQKTELKEKTAECTWYPAHMKVRMDQWIDGLNWDWCISRQRYFGVPFPVWYVKRLDDQSKDAWKIIPATIDQLPVNPIGTLPPGCFNGQPVDGQGYGRACFAAKDILDVNGEIAFAGDKTTILLVTPEADVMDTWATSSVSPQLSSGAITKEYADDYARHQQLFPADLRPQAHEIIRTWAFYTLVKAHLHENTIPWKNLMISGWCLAADKSKMSKSKGNVITPIALIQEKGADVVRYWASTSKLGTDTAFSEDVLKIGKKLVNKLWNATKFAAIHLEKLDSTPDMASKEAASGIISEPLDLWVLTRLHRAIERATREFERYEYSDARAAAEDFFWNDFCDNYLELVKVRVYGNEGSASAQKSAVHTIYHCLNGILRLFAPIVPHVTEELFASIFDAEFAKISSVHARGTWPKAANYPCDEKAEKAGMECVSLLNAVRKQKSERSLSIKFPIDEIAVAADADALLERTFADLKGAANASAIHFGTLKEKSPARFAETKTEDEKFSLQLLFAEQSDAA